MLLRAAFLNTSAALLTMAQPFTSYTLEVTHSSLTADIRPIPCPCPQNIHSTHQRLTVPLAWRALGVKVDYPAPGLRRLLDEVFVRMT